MGEIRFLFSYSDNQVVLAVILVLLATYLKATPIETSEKCSLRSS
jgi:hypothetical protein